MLRFLLITTCILAVFLAYDISRISVPEEAAEPFNVRIFLYIQKFFLIKGDIDELLWGKEYRYEEWVKDMRANIPTYQAKPERIEDGLKISDTVFSGVPVRIYDPITRKRNEGAMIWFHGGGWIFGSADAQDGLHREAAAEMGLMIVSVEYRLAPQHPYPAALDDCYTAVKHFMKHAVEHDVDPTRIAVAGDSAGGNLAAAVSLKLRDERMAPPIKLQVLVYPVVQSVNFNLPSYKNNEHDTILPKESMVAMWLFYAQGNLKNMEVALDNNHAPKELQAKMTSHSMGTTEGDHNETVWNSLKQVMLDPYFAPLMATDLAGLPQTLVYTVVKDVLKDEGTLFAQRLREAGNKVEHYHNKGGFHPLNSWGLPFHHWVKEDARISNTKIRNFVKNNL